MKQQELLRIYSMYLPYGLKIQNGKDIFEVLALGYGRVYFEGGSLSISDVKQILRPLSDLTKEQLQKAGFSDHLDWMTKEREHWIYLYGLETFLNKTPHGMIQYLISKHYDIEDLIGKGLAVNKNESV